MPTVLGFEHPASGKALRFESPLPADYDGSLLDALQRVNITHDRD